MTAPQAYVPTPAKKRGRETALDMVRSLGLILGIIFVLLIITPARGLIFNGSNKVPGIPSTTDSDQLLGWKLLAGSPAVVPNVPSSWTLNGARMSGETKPKADLHLQWLTSGSQYIGLDQGYLPLHALIVNDAGNGLTPSGTVDIDGQTWTTLTGGNNGDSGLAFTRKGLTTLLVSSLPEAQLQPIAATLHPITNGGTT